MKIVRRERSPERSLCSSHNLGTKQHVLQDVITCTLAIET